MANILLGRYYHHESPSKSKTYAPTTPWTIFDNKNSKCKTFSTYPIKPLKPPLLPPITLISSNSSKSTSKISPYTSFSSMFLSPSHSSQQPKSSLKTISIKAMLWKLTANCSLKKSPMNSVKYCLNTGVIINFLVKRKIRANLDYDMLGIDN